VKGFLFDLAFMYARWYGIFSYWRKKGRRKEIEDKLNFFLQEHLRRERLQKVVRHIFELRGTRKVMDYLIPLLDEGVINKFFTIEGRHHLDQALKQGRGVVLFSGHLGNPHLGFCTVRALGYDLIFIKGGRPRERDYGRFHYSETPKDTIFIHDPSLAPVYKERILGTLRRGAILQYYADTREGRRKESVPFLGKTMEFPTGIIHLAHRAKAAIIPFIHLYHRRKITLIFEPRIDHEWEKGEEEYRRIVVEFARLLETYIFRLPEQYMGIYGPTVLDAHYASRLKQNGVLGGDR
jgi:KDO2-lipid IV(A) lauroyltransferase